MARERGKIEREWKRKGKTDGRKWAEEDRKEPMVRIGEDDMTGNERWVGKAG